MALFRLPHALFEVLFVDIEIDLSVQGHPLLIDLNMGLRPDLHPLRAGAASRGPVKLNASQNPRAVDHLPCRGRQLD